MKKRLFNFIATVLIVLSPFTSVHAVTLANLDATQFVSNVTVTNSDGSNIGTNKISDSSTINTVYDLDIGDGSQLDTTQSYTMPLPNELNYETTVPIQLLASDGTILGLVTIKDGTISIQFNDTIKTMENVKIYFNFYSKFNKDQLDYENGNDLIFPTRDNPDNTKHINFSKSSSGGGSGTSAISKNLRYGNPDRTIVTWSITVNNGGYAVEESKFYDEMENTQEYIPGSMRINFRNWNKVGLRSETADPMIKQGPEGKQRFDYTFGRLTSAEEKNDQAVTSITLTYQTKLYDNPDLNRYPNTAYSLNGSTLIDSALSTATYQGQGGGGSGDQLTKIEGQKFWEDNNNVENRRPTEITVQLLRNSALYKQLTVTPNTDGNWLYSFTDLPKNDLNNVPYQYSVQEATPPARYVSTIDGTNITNRYIPETTSVNGIKTWDDTNDSAGKRPESITVHLLANGEEVNEKTVTAADNWQYTFTDLPKEKDGQEITYSISEDSVPNYETIIDGTNITNRYIPETTSVNGIKTWDDTNDSAGKRPESITVHLLANGEEVNEKTVTAADNWQYTFTDLPKEKDGQEITYSISEDSVPNYETIIDGTNITNKYKEVILPVLSKKTNILGEKIWLDNNDQLKMRPSEIKVNLLADGKKISEKTVNDQTEWKYSFKNLPEKANGKKISYRITENPVEGYRTSIIGNDKIINTLISPHIDPQTPERGQGQSVSDSMNSMTPLNNNTYLPGSSNISNSNYKNYPQTNEKKNFWMINAGIISIIITAYILYKRRY